MEPSELMKEQRTSSGMIMIFMYVAGKHTVWKNQYHRIHTKKQEGGWYD